MQEFQQIGGGWLTSITIGDETTRDNVQAYDDFVHKFIFPPQDANAVKELCGDGHEKVIVKVCGGDPLPMKRKKVEIVIQSNAGTQGIVETTIDRACN